jgi:hypothetical protein
MNYLLIIGIGTAVAISILSFYVLLKKTPPIEEDLINDLEKFPEFIHEEVEIKENLLKKEVSPKKKYYKRKKKKPAVANNAQVEKRPVGRPRKTTE